MSDPAGAPPSALRVAPDGPRPRRGLIVVLVSVGVAAVPVMVAFGAWKLVTAATRDGQETASPAPSKAPRKVAIVAPDMLGNRPKNTDAVWVKAAEESAAQYNRLIGAKAFVSVYYGSQDARNLVLINAIDVGLPDGMFHIVLRKTVTIPDIRTVKAFAPVDAGPLGDVAKCGEFELKGVQVAVCGWSDEASVGVVIWHHTSMEQASSEFVATRGAIEHTM